MNKLEELLRLGFEITQLRIQPHGSFVLTAAWRGEMVHVEAADYSRAVQDLYGKAMGVLRRMPAVCAH